jgi:osmotically-inducible protein OsmY
MFQSNDSLPQACRTTIEKAVHKRLNSTGYRSLSLVRCQFHNGTLTLKGEVPSYYHKQIAQEAIRKIGNVTAIENKIDVWSQET